MQRTFLPLVVAGERLLAERPLHAVSIDEIVAAAGVSKGSFFNQFGDKTGFARRVAMKVTVDLDFRALAQLRDRGVHATLAWSMIIAAAYALAKPETVRTLANVTERWPTRSGFIYQLILENFQGRRERDRLLARSPEIAAMFWLGCCHALTDAIIAQHASLEEAGELCAGVMEIGLQGIGEPSHHVQSMYDPEGTAEKIRTLLDLWN